MITEAELDRKIALFEERMARRIRNGEFFFQHHKEHQSGGKDALTTSAASLTVKEIDGSPSVTSVNTIKFSNGTVTDDGSGVVTVSTGGSSSGGTPAVVLGSAVAAGAAATFLRTDDTIKAFDTTVPSTQAFGDSAAVGTAAFAARRDHLHAMPANPVTAHVAAGDPHTQYRLESDNHTHASSGAQGGALYSYVNYLFQPDTAPGQNVTAQTAKTYHHSGPSAETADALYVDAVTAPGASGLPITVAYADTNDLDTAASWTTIATVTLSSEKSTLQTSMTNASIPANRLIRMVVGTIVGTPQDVTANLRVKRPLVT